jgi:transcriptional regulator with XRE-family HTH domain
MPDNIPNVQLRAWRNEKQLTRAEMADRINATPTGISECLTCDEERIRRWEAGEVSWPHTSYRLALTQLTDLQPWTTPEPSCCFGSSRPPTNAARSVSARTGPSISGDVSCPNTPPLSAC